MRIGPYMTGSAFGFAIHHFRKRNSQKLMISRRLIRAYWIIAAAVFLLSLFVAYDKSITFGILFPGIMAFGRHFIGALVGSLIVACSFQCGGWLGRFLSSRLFVHLNRLTYFGYLLNPVVVVALRGASESSDHFDVASMVTYARYNISTLNCFFFPLFTTDCHGVFNVGDNLHVISVLIVTI